MLPKDSNNLEDIVKLSVSDSISINYSNRSRSHQKLSTIREEEEVEGIEEIEEPDTICIDSEAPNAGPGIETSININTSTVLMEW